MILRTCHLLDQRTWAIINIQLSLRVVLLILNHRLYHLRLVLQIKCLRVLHISFTHGVAERLVLAIWCLFHFRKNLLAYTLFDRIVFLFPLRNQFIYDCLCVLIRFYIGLILVSISVFLIILNIVNIIILRDLVKRIYMLKYRVFIFETMYLI